MSKEENLDWLGIVVAGLTGTAIITMLMYMGPMMGMPRMDIARLLGSMVLPLGSSAFALGMMVHFAMGIVFALVYATIWSAAGIDVTWWSGLIFGAVHTVVAFAGMGMIMPMHKEVRAGSLASPLSGGARGMMGMLMGHLVFGVVVALVYSAFA